MVRDARMENLPAVVGFVEDACRAFRADRDSMSDLVLAVEEVFTNIVHHGYRGGAGPVTLTAAPVASGLAVTVRDEAIAFDPALAPLPDLERDWRDRSAGGLGWHLVRQLVDEIHYRPGEAGGNIVTLVKRLPARSP